MRHCRSTTLVWKSWIAFVMAARCSERSPMSCWCCITSSGGKSTRASGSSGGWVRGGGGGGGEGRGGGRGRWGGGGGGGGGGGLLGPCRGDGEQGESRNQGDTKRVHRILRSLVDGGRPSSGTARNSSSPGSASRKSVGAFHRTVARSIVTPPPRSGRVSST